MEEKISKGNYRFRINKITFTFVILLFYTNVIAQSIQWQKSLGGTGVEIATAIEETTDKGFIVVGYSGSNDGDVTNHHGNYGVDYWIVKLDYEGTIQWQKSLGGLGDDYAFSVNQTTDGGYIVAGSSYSIDGDLTMNYGSLDYWIVRLDSYGNIDWQKSFGGAGIDEAQSIQQTEDKGFIVAGYTYSKDGNVNGNHGQSDYWIIKLDSIGNIQWSKLLGGTNDERASSIQQTKDKGYIVAGYSYSNDGDVTDNHGLCDYWIIKLDSNGGVQWQKMLGGTLEERASSIKQTTEGGYIIAGFSYSNDGNVTDHRGNNFKHDYWIVKIDENGNLQWQKSLGGTNDDGATSVFQTFDNHYIVVGYSVSDDGDITEHRGWADYWIVKLDSTGTLVWQKGLGGTSSELAFSIQQTNEGGYIIGGNSSSMDNDVTGNHGGEDFWIVKLDDMQTGTININGQQNILIYPNPASEQLTIDLIGHGFIPEGTTVSLLSATGEKVLEKSVTDFITSLNVEGQPKGLYFIKIENTDKYYIEKLILY